MQLKIHRDYSRSYQGTVLPQNPVQEAMTVSADSSRELAEKKSSTLSFGADPVTLTVLGSILNMAVTVFVIGFSERVLTTSYVRNKAGYLSSTLKHLDGKITLMQNNPQQAKSHLVKEYNDARSYLYAKYEKYVNPFKGFYKWHKIVPKTDFVISEKKLNKLVKDLKLKGFPNAAQVVEDHLKYINVKKIVETLPKA